MGQLDLHLVASKYLHVLNQLDVLDPPNSVVLSGVPVHFAHSQEVFCNHAGSGFHGVVRVEQSVQRLNELGCVPGLNLLGICRQNSITGREGRLRAT